MWEQLGSALWRGELTDDVVRPLESEVFQDFEEWHRKIYHVIPGRHAGLLPGEGALRWEVAGQSIGLVTVNTVFRMVSADANAGLAGCSEEQLKTAVGEEFEDWAENNNLTLLLAGRTGSLPDLSGLRSPVLPLAGSGEADGPWSVLPRGTACVHQLLSVDIARDTPIEVTDAGTGHKLALQGPGYPVPGAASAPATAPLPPEESYDEEALLEAFYQQAATGRMVLVLVSGPEADGGPINSDELNQRLAQAAFGAVPHPVPALQETWAAVREELTPHQLQQHLQALRCSPDTFPQAGHQLLLSPWWRIYDFTGSDTFAIALASDPKLAESVSLVNVGQDGPGIKKNVIEVVPMNGMVGNTPEAVDFGYVPMNGTDPRSLWFRQFQAEVLVRPTLFMALSPGSAVLWGTLALTGRLSGAEEFPGFIVTPGGTLADRARLRRAALSHIRQTPFAFSIQRLRSGHQSLIEGKRLLSQSYAGERKGTGVARVTALVGEASKGSRDFLEGRDPAWGDIIDKVAADLSMVEAMEKAARPGSGGRAPIVLLKGSAGSGKTTALMQYAYRLHKMGKNVGWVDRNASLSRRDIEIQALEQKVNAVFVDDVDIFGSQAASMLKNLSNGGQNLVVAAIRTTRAFVLDATFTPNVVSSDTPLNDNDLKNIVKVLKKNGLLGILKQYRLPQQRINMLRQICEQSLLAAMIQVVTGEQFEAKIQSEFQQLDGGQRAAYAVVCLFESALVYKQRGIDEEDLLLIVASPAAPTRRQRDDVSQLLRMGMLVRGLDGRLRCRQRVIADSVVDSVLRANQDQLASVARHLLVFYAARARNIQDNDHPLRRAMIKLLSHTLMRDLKLPVETVRAIYDAAHDSLQDDRHYWLQRGSFELEHGHLRIARNHLETAKGCDGGEQDPLVRTTSSAVHLRSATEAPKKPGLEAAAIDAVHDLHAVTKQRGASAPHSYAILAREGTKWLQACTSTLGAQVFLDMKTLILEVVSEGRRFCRDNHQFMDIAATYEPALKKLQPKGPGIPL
ncbi:P-loop NTPase [Streptomyces sp. 7N604]|uniref:P-loop NTPase n=1 Tax=Streptomyces sp. 7N604 TaxID=3457415 RepID=UPI003FD5CCEA